VWEIWQLLSYNWGLKECHMKMQDRKGLYSGFAGQWDALPRPIHSEAALSVFLDLLAPGSHVLDLGAGVGQDAGSIIEAGHRVSALDVSQEMLGRLEARCGRVKGGRPDQLILVHKDARLWSPSSGVFDGVWANDFFPDLGIEEMHRVLGVLFRSMKPRAPLGIVMRVGVGKLEEMPLGYDGPVRTLTLIEALPFASMLNQCGFEIEKEGTLSGHPSLKIVICRRISSDVREPLS
jgi:SAM-dependent methyltransferase